MLAHDCSARNSPFLSTCVNTYFSVHQVHTYTLRLFSITQPLHSCTISSILFQPLSPVHTLPTFRALLDRELPRPKHNLLIQFAARSPRLEMPRSQAAFVGVFAGMPEAYLIVSAKVHSQLAIRYVKRRRLIGRKDVGKKKEYANVHVARFLLSPSVFPNQYFNNPPLSHASRWLS